MAGLALSLLGAAIALGLLTPLTNGIVILIELVLLLMHNPGLDAAQALDAWQPVVLQMAIAAALVLMGPGAYSIDRRLFGRVEIVFRPRLQNGRAGSPRK